MKSFSIEICGSQCDRHFFYPTRWTLRGRIDASKMLHLNLEAWAVRLLFRVKSIPGERIAFDPVKMQGFRFDPLADGSEYEKADWIAIVGVLERVGVNSGCPLKPADADSVHLSIDAGNGAILAKDFVYWMVRAVESGHAIVVDGELPSMESVMAMTGPRTRDPGNTGSQENVLERYVFNA